MECRYMFVSELPALFPGSTGMATQFFPCHLLCSWWWALRLLLSRKRYSSCSLLLSTNKSYQVQLLALWFHPNFGDYHPWNTKNISVIIVNSFRFHRLYFKYDSSKLCEYEQGSITHRSTSSSGLYEWHNESLSVATRLENSRKILHLNGFRLIPSPHVTLHGDHSVSWMNLFGK